MSERKTHWSDEPFLKVLFSWRVLLCIAIGVSMARFFRFAAESNDLALVLSLLCGVVAANIGIKWYALTWKPEDSQ